MLRSSFLPASAAFCMKMKENKRTAPTGRADDEDAQGSPGWLPCAFSPYRNDSFDGLWLAGRTVI